MLPQFLANILVTASVILTVGVSFAIIFGTVRFFHFAHAIVFTSGAYATYLFYRLWGFPLVISFVAGSVTAAALGCFLELLFYRPLRRRNSSPISLLLVSLGLYVLLQNVISLCFGDDTKSLRPSNVTEGLNVLGARITTIQIVIVFAGVLMVSMTYLFIRKSKFGKAMRGVANDRELARLSGVDSNKIILLVFALGSALAGAAGTLVALDVDMTPTMGMGALLSGVVAVIIGGVGSIPGIALAALLLSVAQHIGGWNIGSQWQETTTFVVLVIFLMARPEGFFGKKLNKALI